MVTHHGGCHCGRVRFEADAPAEIQVDECNCSICGRVGYLHLVVPKSRFGLLSGEDALTSYRFNTGTAHPRFCSVCSIKSFYTPRSHPDGVSVDARCLDAGTVLRRTIRPSDGAIASRADRNFSAYPVRSARDLACRDVDAILWLPRRKSKCSFRARLSSFKISSRTRHIAGRTYAAPAGRAVSFVRAAVVARQPLLGEPTPGAVSYMSISGLADCRQRLSWSQSQTSTALLERIPVPVQQTLASGGSVLAWLARSDRGRSLPLSTSHSGANRIGRAFSKADLPTVCLVE